MKKILFSLLVALSLSATAQINPYNPTWYDSRDTISSGVVKAASGSLYGLTGLNSNSSTVYIMVFDTTVVPADGSIPNLPPIEVPTGTNFSWNSGNYPRGLKYGLVFVTSSTPTTKTAVVKKTTYISIAYK